MKAKGEYMSMVDFQEKYNKDPEVIVKALNEFWGTLLKTKLVVTEWNEVDEQNKKTNFWFCTVIQPKADEGRAESIGTGIGGIELLLTDISREEFMIAYEVIYNKKAYDAGEFWDRIKQIKQNI